MCYYAVRKRTKRPQACHQAPRQLFLSVGSQLLKEKWAVQSILPFCMFCHLLLFEGCYSEEPQAEHSGRILERSSGGVCCRAIPGSPICSLPSFLSSEQQLLLKHNTPLCDMYEACLFLMPSFKIQNRACHFKTFIFT